MPNWVKNKVIVGQPKYIDEIRAAHATKGSDGTEECFDFNTVIPMPREMNIEFGSRSDDGLCLYATELDPRADYLGARENKLSPREMEQFRRKFNGRLLVSEDFFLSKEQVDDLRRKYGKDFAKIIALGKQMSDNVDKYGAMNWYEWSIKNWGTKWNSADTEWNDTSFTFDTAWDPATPVIVEMSKMHPDIRMAFLYSDENIGSHTGYMLLTGGRIDKEGSFPDQSPDAYKEAFDLWGCEDEYRFNEETGTYERKPEPILKSMNQAEMA